MHTLCSVSSMNRSCLAVYVFACRTILRFSEEVWEKVYVAK